MTKLLSRRKGPAKALITAAAVSRRPPLVLSLLIVSWWILVPFILAATFLFEDGFQSVPSLVGYGLWLGCWALALRALARRSRRMAVGLGLLLGLIVVMVHPVWKERAFGELYEDFRVGRAKFVDSACREELLMSREVRAQFTTSWMAGARWTETLSGLSEPCANQVRALPPDKHFSTVVVSAGRAP